MICSPVHIALQMKSFRCLSLMRELHMSHEAPCVHARITVVRVTNPRNLLIPNECTAHTRSEVFAPCLSSVVVKYSIRRSLFQWRPTVSRSAQPMVSASTEDSIETRAPSSLRLIPNDQPLLGIQHPVPRTDGCESRTGQWINPTCSLLRSGKVDGPCRSPVPTPRQLSVISPEVRWTLFRSRRR